MGSEVNRGNLHEGGRALELDPDGLPDEGPAVRSDYILCVDDGLAVGGAYGCPRPVAVTVQRDQLGFEANVGGISRLGCGAQHWLQVLLWQVAGAASTVSVVDLVQGASPKRIALHDHPAVSRLLATEARVPGDPGNGFSRRARLVDLLGEAELVQDLHRAAVEVMRFRQLRASVTPF